MSTKTRLLLLAAIIVLAASPAGGASGADHQAAKPLPSYGLSVSFDLEKSLVRGEAKIIIPEGVEVDLLTGGLRITSLRLDGAPLSVDPGMESLSFLHKGTVEMAYEASFPEGSEGGLISEDGISLTGRWYPQLRGMARYSLKALLPEGFTAVSEAEEASAAERPGGREFTFDFPHPLQGVDLAAGRYVEVSDSMGGVKIYAYFFREDAGLAAGYIARAKEFLALYDGLLTPYPYRRFSIVENVLPTGYSMPTFTLLGREVVRLPFIEKTSLGHEILHQWFGNSVYCDCGEGNWLEGLTTCLADQLYSEREGKGRDYRKGLLTKYQAYVQPDKAAPLLDFVEAQSGPALRAVGYGKGAMFFHMLKGLVGEKAFYASLKSFIDREMFRPASWRDIRAAFEEDTGEDLRWFFKQWLTRKDVPSVEITDPAVFYPDGVPTVSFRVRQGGEPYTFTLPVKVVTDEGEFVEDIKIEEKEKAYELKVKGTPLRMSFDEDYDLMRSLSPEEYAPVIWRLLGDEKRLALIPGKGERNYAGLIEAFKARGFEAKDEAGVKDEELRASSLVVFGLEGRVLRRLFGGVAGHLLYGKAPEGKCPEGFSFAVRENPLDPSKVVAIACASSKEEAGAVREKLFHYGDYSLVSFKAGENTAKDTGMTMRGIPVNLHRSVTGMRPADTESLEEIIGAVAGTPIIYIGEDHTSYPDHRAQLEVIRGLHRRGRDLAIGMEMFQRPFQKALDDYVSGAIGEKEFLKASEYFKRWRFDYNLYREILQYARANRIPVVALNIRQEILEKVSKGGLDSLSAEELAEIPPDMDMADYGYRERLMKVFGQHPGQSSFDNFYQSQILWDETMAHSVAEYLKGHPGGQMVVLAGAGHIINDSGIPARALRLTRKPFVTIIAGRVESPERGIGNYVVFPTALPEPPSPKLGVLLEQAEKGMRIEDFTEGSAALKAGLEKGDVIIHADGLEVGSVEDIRISLVGKKPGDTLKVKVLRKGLFETRELDFDVVL